MENIDGFAKKVRLLRLSGFEFAATYEKVRLTPQSLRALHPELFAVPSTINR